MVSINEFSNRELQKMDIHELRVLARQVGVSSPTSKKKADLIDCIISIITGKTVPELKNINRGRPAKHIISEYNIESSSEYKSIFEIGEFQDDMFVASPSTDYSLNKRNTVVHGVVTKQPDGIYLKKFKFADTLDDALVSADMVEVYALKENDVVAYTKVNSSVTIHSINGKPANATGKVCVAGKNIVLGKRNIVFASSITEKRDFLLQLQNWGKIVYIPSNNVPVVSAPNITTLPLVHITDEEIINNFCSSCDVAQFYKRSGGNIMFVADNFLSVMSALKQFETEKSLQLEQEVFNRIKNLVEMGITFIAIIPSSLNNIFSNFSTTFDNIC